MIIKIEATLTSFASLKDRTLKFAVYTQELPAQMKTALFEQENRIGWLYFSPAPLAAEMLKENEPVEPNGIKLKTPSQRLRAVIAAYLLEYGREHNKIITQTQINHYYEREIERMIEEWKKKIDSLKHEIKSDLE